MKNLNKNINIIFGAVIFLAFLFAVQYFLFSPSEVSAAWYATGGLWTGRKTIDINHMKVSSTTGITNFPMVFSVTDLDLRSTGNGGGVGQTDGGDILFTASDGSTKLSHEIEKYTPATGELVAWVKIPFLSSTSTTRIYIYYGDDDVANQFDTTNVWDTNFKAVWHMEDDPSVACSGVSELCDSTSNARNADSNGAMTSGDLVSGKIGNSIDFDGSNDYFDTSTALSNFITNTNATMEAWAYPTEVGPTITSSYDGNTIVGDAGGFMGIHQGTISSVNNLWSQNYDGTDDRVGSPYTGSVWTQIVLVHTGGTLFAYKNGVLVSSTASGNTNSLASNIRIGRAFSSNYFGGLIDEVRVSNTARTSDWILTQYNNQNDPSSFYSYGGEEVENKTVTSTKVSGGVNTSNGSRPPVKLRGGVKFR